MKCSGAEPQATTPTGLACYEHDLCAIRHGVAGGENLALEDELLMADKHSRLTLQDVHQRTGLAARELLGARDLGAPCRTGP